ncbi:MAG: hypothetical protein E7016_07340 [Alphaproteobacteria bacterium]|nr:hypothetical protein [Alphaproteobacteria bacterium]
MRKYFLLSAVALMAASTANATTEYAEVTARATIEVAGSLDCSDMDFGTIVVKQNNVASKVWSELNGDFPDTQYSGDVLSISDASTCRCNRSSYQQNIYESDATSAITLKGTKDPSKTIEVSNIHTVRGGSAGFNVFADLDIPPSVAADTYTGTFTVSTVYE